MTSDIYNPLYVDFDYYTDHLEEEDALYKKIRSNSEKISDIVFDENTPTIIKSICQRFTLTDQQSALLSRLIRKILVAEVFIGDLIKELQGQLDLPPSKAQELADALAAELFAPAKDELKELHAKTFGGQQPKQEGNVLNLKT